MGNDTKKDKKSNSIAKNRRARFDYEIISKFEAGICLVGTEVKSLRGFAVRLEDAHVEVAQSGEVKIFNLYIGEYLNAGPKIQHKPKRSRDLLLHKAEIKKIASAVQKKGMTVVALSIYFNNWGLVKVEIALAKGKTGVDKRSAIKTREWNISKQRILKNYN